MGVPRQTSSWREGGDVDAWDCGGPGHPGPGGCPLYHRVDPGGRGGPDGAGQPGPYRPGHPHPGTIRFCQSGGGHGVGGADPQRRAGSHRCGRHDRAPGVAPGRRERSATHRHDYGPRRRAVGLYKRYRRGGADAARGGGHCPARQVSWPKGCFRWWAGWGRWR